MNRSISAISAAALGLVFVSGACGSGYDGDTAAADASALSFSRGHRSRVHPGTGGSVGSTATPPATPPMPPATPPTPPATSDVNAVIAAAQTPDGTAIPQGPGPNGQCPEVLVLLGFWSCPQIGQTCSYQSAGANHNCACDRLDGEGGLPAWVCDQ